MAQQPSSRAHSVATAHLEPARPLVDPEIPGTPSLVPPSGSPSGMAVREEVCSHCGGSGRLRINDDSFRTCLDCLGQGVQSHFGPSPQLAEWIVPRTIGGI